MVLKKNKNGGIKVYCRFKPILSALTTPIKYTLSKRYKSGSLTMNLENQNIEPENSKYKFHDVFPSTSSQSMVFEKVASPMIDGFVQKGQNCTIFSYGQTGSGKTYTICGSKLVIDKGIIHRTIDQLFDLTQPSSSGAEYEISLSFIEIHNNAIRDLATPKEPNNKTEPYRILVTNKSDAIKLFEEMKLRRKTTATSKNEHSSRSHFICTVYLRKNNDRGFNAQFKLVDLAGSEDYNSIGSDTQNQIEALAIKKSLYTLKNITRILANPGFKGIIPYRDSKLTYELRSTLERKCDVAMIANVDSNDLSIRELINTFEYAREVGSIKKCPADTLKRAPSFDMSDAQLLKIENENLRFQNSSLKTKYENEISSLNTKYENSVQEMSLLKKQMDLLGRKDREVQDTKSKRENLELFFMKNCLDHSMFAQKQPSPCTVTVFEDEDDGPAGPPRRRDACDGWRPYDRGCYHKARCGVRSGEAAACGFCEFGLKPVREPATATTATATTATTTTATTTATTETRFYHYLACRQKIAGRPCVGHTGGGGGGGGVAKRAYFSVKAAAVAETTRDVRPAAVVAGARRPVVGARRPVAGARRPAAVVAGARRPAAVVAGARQWLPYGRDGYHEIRCPRSTADGRADAATAAACLACDFGHVRERVDVDGGDGWPRYVHYVWCPNKMNGRPCDEGLATLGQSSSAAAAAASAQRPAAAVVAAQRARAKNSEPPRAKNSEPPRAKNSEPPRAKNSEPPRAKNSEPPRAKNSEPPRARNSGPPRARNSGPPPRAKNSGPPRTISVAPRPSVAAKQTLPTDDFMNIFDVEYYESFLKSMEVPDKFTLRK